MKTPVRWPTVHLKPAMKMRESLVCRQFSPVARKRVLHRVYLDIVLVGGLGRWGLIVRGECLMCVLTVGFGDGVAVGGRN